MKNENDRYLKSFIFTLLSAIILIFFKEYIIEILNASNFIFYSLNYSSIIIITFVFIYSFKLNIQLNSLSEIFNPFKNQKFCLYALFLYFIIFSLDIFVSNIIFAYIYNLDVKYNIDFYIKMYKFTIERSFNSNISILEKMEMIKFIIWNIIILIYIICKYKMDNKRDYVLKK